MTLWQQTDGNGVPLVLVHGWGMNAAVWEPLLELLTPKYRVTRVELPGHGYSAMNDEHYSLNAWAEALVEIAPDNAIWLGWSLGGLVVLQAAVEQLNRNSANIRALYMMSATPCFAQKENWRCAMPVATLQQFAENLEKNVEATLLRFLSLQIKGSEHSRDLLKQLRKGFAKRPAPTAAALKTGLGFLRDANISTELETIRLPIHWTFGQRDTLVPACAAESIQQLMPDASLQVVEGAGHVPFLSHPEDCLQSLDTLAARTSGKS